jgi:hypothetical protein
MPSLQSVHEIEIGGLGIVAHKMKPDQFNSWRKIPSNQINKLTDLVCDDDYYRLSLHVPHGTLLLILNKLKLATVEVTHSVMGMPYKQILYKDYYQCFWDESKILIKCEQVINPYHS